MDGINGDARYSGFFNLFSISFPLKKWKNELSTQSFQKFICHSLNTHVTTYFRFHVNANLILLSCIRWKEQIGVQIQSSFMLCLRFRMQTEGKLLFVFIMSLYLWRKSIFFIRLLKPPFLLKRKIIIFIVLIITI